MELSHHQFCLKWNNHSSNLLKVFGRLFSNESFTDVTLAAEGRSIRAHKMVLSACSTYFEQLFLEHAEPPIAGPMIVIMRETSFDDLAIIVEFMYKGEINVSQDQLGSLLRTAESLRVKGLAQASSSTTNSSDASSGDAVHQHSPMAQQQPQQASAATVPASSRQQKTPTPPTPPSHPAPAHAGFSPPPYAVHQASVPPPQQPPPPPPPPALLPLFQNAAAALLSVAANTALESSGRESPSSKRRRIRSTKVEPQDYSNHSDGASSANFTPRIDSVVTVGSRHEDVPRSGDVADGSALDLRLTDPTHLQELTARLELRSNLHSIPQPAGDSETLRKVQQDKSEPHCYFRGFAVYKFNDYIAHGTRQQYWEEPFTKAVMEGIQDRELDLKKGAELLGVSYSTLYGRYRECHGYLRHAWTRDYRRTSGSAAGGGGASGNGGGGGGGEWWESDPHDQGHRRGENGAMPGAEELVVEVDSYVDDADDTVERDSPDKPGELDSKQQTESLILSIRHGKVQRKLQGHKESL